MNLYSPRVICWVISNRTKKNLAISALNMALALRKPADRGIHHTYRGATKAVRTTTRNYCENTG